MCALRSALGVFGAALLFSRFSAHAQSPSPSSPSEADRRSGRLSRPIFSTHSCKTFRCSSIRTPVILYYNRPKAFSEA